VRFAIRARGEVQVGGDARRAGSTERQAPQAVNRRRTFFRAFEQAAECAVGVERHDGAAAEVAHQQLVRMCAEAARRQCHAPGRVHLANVPADGGAGGEAMERAVCDIEGINQSAAAARVVIMFGGVLFGKRDKHVPGDVLHVERRISGRGMGVGELANELSGRVVLINRAFAEVGREQNDTAVVSGDGDTFIHCIGPGGQHLGRIAQGAPPARDRAVFTGENERVAVEARSGVVKQAGNAAVARNRDYPCIPGHMGSASSIVGDGVQGRFAGAIVTDPERPGGAEG